MAKFVAFFNESTADTWVDVSVNGGTPISVGIVVSSLPTSWSSGTPFFQDTNPNSVVDACTKILDNQTAVATFRRTDNSTYTQNSHDFVGGRPIER